MDWGQFWQFTLFNAYLGIVPALIGLVLAVPLGILCVRFGWLYGPVLSITSIIYAIPSLALFVVLIDYTGLGFLTVMIPLALFSLCVLVPNVVDGLRAVPDSVRQAATAMGFSTLRRLIQVELPLATPVIIAGLRVATVSSISLASVGGLIGVSSLGYFFVDGLGRSFYEEIYWAIVFVIVIALASDFVLVGVRWLLTPWNRSQRSATSPVVAAAGGSELLQKESL